MDINPNKPTHGAHTPNSGRGPKPMAFASAEAKSLRMRLFRNGISLCLAIQFVVQAFAGLKAATQNMVAQQAKVTAVRIWVRLFMVILLSFVFSHGVRGASRYWCSD